MAGIYSQGGSAGHRYAGWLETVEAKNFQFGGKVFNGSPSAIYVGSNLVWGSDWLTVAAQKAIRGAFGVDGNAVIEATNAYLNQLAASDRDKATALAALINEDPMMVCSLGLEPQGVTMPIRYLNSNGTPWIRSGIYPELQHKFRLHGKIKWNALSGTQLSGVQGYFFFGASGSGYCFASTSSDISGAVTNRIVDFDILFDSVNNSATATFDGTSRTKNVSFTIVLDNLQFSLFSMDNHVYPSNCGFPSFTIEKDGVVVREFLPMRLGKAWSADKVSTGVAQAKDTLGMIDLVTGIFYPNAASSGAFTMEGELHPLHPITRPSKRIKRPTARFTHRKSAHFV